MRIFEVSIPSLLSESDPIQVLDSQFAVIAALRRMPVGLSTGDSINEMRSPGTPIKSSYLHSAVSTPGSASTSTTTAATPSSSSSSVASAQRNNTFAYRSPAAMAASAVAAASASANVSMATPSTSKKAGFLNTPAPSTPIGKTPLPVSTAKKGLLGGRTPPPTSFKDMLNASRAGKASKVETPATPAMESKSEGRFNEDKEEENVQYLPEMAFIVIDEVSFSTGRVCLQRLKLVLHFLSYCRLTLWGTPVSRTKTR